MFSLLHSPRTTSNKQTANRKPESTKVVATSALTIDTEETTATSAPPSIRQVSSPPKKSFIEKLTNREPLSSSSESQRGNLNILPRSMSADDEQTVESPSNKQSMVTKTLSMMHLKGNKAPTQNLRSATEEYQKDLNGALTWRLKEIDEEQNSSISNSSTSTPSSLSILFYDLGLNYMKIAHTHDILKHEGEANSNRQAALEAFDQAIALVPHERPNELALYKANKAKCLYNMYDANDENDTRLNEAKTLAQQHSNVGVANETLGYIYTCFGEYEKALGYFEKSLDDPEYKAAHKILSLYDQTVLLAALGRKEDAIARFKRAEGKKLPVDIDTEDKILITEIRTEKYKDYIFKLANSAHSGGRLRSVSDVSAPDDDSITGLFHQREQKLKSVTVALLPGTKSQLDEAVEGLTSIKEQTSAIHNQIAIESRPYLNDKTKLQTAINHNNTTANKELIEIQKDIASNSRLRSFSDAIESCLNAKYTGSQAVASTEVQGQAPNKYGWMAWGVSQLKDHTPIPIQFGLTPISYGLDAKNDAIKVARADNFLRDTAPNTGDMEVLATEIALKLTIIHKKNLNAQLTSTDSDTVNSQPKTRTFFKVKAHTENEESRIAGKQIAEFIASLIFDGRLEDIEPDKKVETILGYVALHNEHYSNLPEHSTTISRLTLTNIKTLHTEQQVLWKTNDEAEGQFTRAVATSIAHINFRNDRDHTEMSTELAKTVSTDGQVITVTHRASQPWKKKAYVETKHFMSDLDYFSTHVIKTIQHVKPQPDSARASLNSIEMNDIPLTPVSTSRAEEGVVSVQHIIFAEDRGGTSSPVDLSDINLTPSSTSSAEELVVSVVEENREVMGDSAETI